MKMCFAMLAWFSGCVFGQQINTTASLHFLTAPRVQWMSTQSGPGFETTNIPAEGITIHGAVICGTAIKIEWSTVAGTIYTIQTSLDLVDWESSELRILGNGETYEFFANADETFRYYRVLIIS